jgi:hypothetical protein
MPKAATGGASKELRLKRKGAPQTGAPRNHAALKIR